MRETPQHNPLPFRRKIHQLNLAWNIRLRWVAIIGQTVVILAARDVFYINFPYTYLFIILGLETLSNIALVLWARHRTQISESLVGSVLVCDILFLTSLLYWTGGSFNPFSLLYFIHIALAALLLRSSWTWAVTVQCTLSYGLLFFIYSPQDLSWVLRPELGDIETQGRWASFAVTAGVLAFFINRIQRALTRREAEIVRIRDAQMRSERLASLATLAAGAAHEFSTPLATIAVIAGELERGLESCDADRGLVDDTRLIRAEVERCRYILQQMSAHSGESLGELSTTITVGDLVDATLDGLPRADRVRIILEIPAHISIRAPMRALGQALRGLLNNALDASPTDQEVSFIIGAEERILCIEVRDDGEGMPEGIAARVGEPFFTTKSPGKGMGLGVFLARSLIEKIDGEFKMNSIPGQGTTVTIHIPRALKAKRSGSSSQKPDPHSITTPEVSYD